MLISQELNRRGYTSVQVRFYCHINFGTKGLNSQFSEALDLRIASVGCGPEFGQSGASPCAEF